MLGELRGVLTSHEDGGQRGASPSRNSACLSAKPWEHPIMLLAVCLSVLQVQRREHQEPCWEQWAHHSCSAWGLASRQALTSQFWGHSASRGQLFLAMRGCSLHGAAVGVLCMAGAPLSSHAPGQGGFSQNKKQLAWTQVLPVLSLVTVTWPHCPQCSWSSLSLPCEVLHCSIPSVPQGLPALPGFYCPAQDFGSEKCCCIMFLDSFFLP